MGGHKWKTAERNQLRLDIDAGFNVSKKVACIAAVLRKFKGEVLGAKAKTIIWSGSAVVAELEAIPFGMDFCKTHCFSSICICSDSLIVVQAVANRGD